MPDAEPHYNVREQTGNPEHASVDDVVDLVIYRAQNPRTDHEDAHLATAVAALIDRYGAESVQTVIHCGHFFIQPLHATVGTVDYSRSGRWRLYMAIDRVTVSLDRDAKEALDDLTERTGHGQSELLRRALTFYAANYQAATTDAGTKLGDYHKMLSGGEHVLLDVDFLHCFLDYVSDSDDEPDPEFLAKADQVSEYHAHEYDGEFETL